MQGKTVIVVVALLSVLLLGLIFGIVYSVLSGNSNEDAIIATGEPSDSDSHDSTTIAAGDINDEPNEEITHVAPHEEDFTGHQLIGTWKNTLEEILDVDISFMETTLEFSNNGDVIRESVGVKFRYEWTLEDDVLYMKSFGAWGNIHNPENDKIYALTWITTDSFSIDFYNNDEQVIFDRIS